LRGLTCGACTPAKMADRIGLSSCGYHSGHGSPAKRRHEQAPSGGISLRRGQPVRRGLKRNGEDVKVPSARCRECPLADQPFVPGNGPARTDLVVVGQAPGDQEVRQGKPFVGPAGKALRRVLDSLGVDHLSKVFFTNTVLCHPGKNEGTSRDEKPPRAAIAACRERLRREIEETGPGWILAVGAVAGASVTGKRVVLSRSRCSLLGHPLRPDGISGYDAVVGITHHPSAPLPKLLLDADIRALLSFPHGGRTPDVYREDRGVSTDH